MHEDGDAAFAAPFSISMSLCAVAADEAGCCPVINRSSWTKQEPWSGPLDGTPDGRLAPLWRYGERMGPDSDWICIVPLERRMLR